MDDGGRVWFLDDYHGARIYTHRPTYGGWGRRFSHGGTMLSLCRELQRYIIGTRDDLPLNHLGPWHPELQGGDLWGYGHREMEKVRAECASIAEGEKDAFNQQRPRMNGKRA